MNNCISMCVCRRRRRSSVCQKHVVRCDRFCASQKATHITSARSTASWLSTTDVLTADSQSHSVDRPQVDHFHNKSWNRTNFISVSSRFLNICCTLFSVFRVSYCHAGLRIESDIACHDVQSLLRLVWSSQCVRDYCISSVI